MASKAVGRAFLFTLLLTAVIDQLSLGEIAASARRTQDITDIQLRPATRAIMRETDKLSMPVTVLHFTDAIIGLALVMLIEEDEQADAAAGGNE